MRKGPIAIIVVIVIVSSTLLVWWSLGTNNIKIVDIDGDEQLISFTSTNHIDGDGSPNHPFIFENIHFTTGIDGTCFSLSNVTAHVVVRNCSFQGYAESKLSRSGTGMRLDNVSNVDIDDCDYSICIVGVNISKSNDIFLRRNNFHETYADQYSTFVGLKISHSDNLTVVSNRFVCNLPLALSNCTDVQFVHNLIYSAGPVDMPIIIENCSAVEIAWNNIGRREGQTIEQLGVNELNIHDNTYEQFEPYP